MARLGSTGNIRVWWVETIAAPNAPTVAEITAGVDLTPFMRRDGLATPRSGQTIDASDAASRVNKKAPGNIDAGEVTFRGLRDSVAADDDGWTTLAEDEAGYLVVRRFGGSTVAATAADKVEVYEGSVISREAQPIGDEVQNFVAVISVENVYQDATVAA
jgi:hypothetical protein